MISKTAGLPARCFTARVTQLRHRRLLSANSWQKRTECATRSQRNTKMIHAQNAREQPNKYRRQIHGQALTGASVRALRPGKSAKISPGRFARRFSDSPICDSVLHFVKSAPGPIPRSALGLIREGLCIGLARTDSAVVLRGFLSAKRTQCAFWDPAWLARCASIPACDVCSIRTYRLSSNTFGDHLASHFYNMWWHNCGCTTNCGIR